ncbi:MAG: TetR/AcrR family transcriptional regulator, partial [Spirochaetales bacterium]|nr:TetR/AcrR family transcriptional regulator [Spirochaetales bacterium]
MNMESREKIEKGSRRPQREKEIIEAAEKLFLEKGFHKTTVSHIVRACDLTNAALYLYFKNKEELILVIMTRITHRFAQLLEERNAPPLSGYERLAECVNFYRDSFTTYHRYHVLDAQFNNIFTETYPDSPWLEEYYQANRRIFSALRSPFEAGLADGTIRLPLTGENGLERTVHMFLNVTNSYMEKLSLRRGIMEKEQKISLETELAD